MFLVYHPEYDYQLDGFEKKAPFLNKKYSTTYDYLWWRGLLIADAPKPKSARDIERKTATNFIEVHTPYQEIWGLDLIHSQEYLSALAETTSETVFNALEIQKSFATWQERMLRTKSPSDVISKAEVSTRIVQAQREGSFGTVTAAMLAMKNRGWAINLSGGYHHASRNHGHGFCLFADAPLAIHHLLEQDESYRILIVDLDAHFGDGNMTALRDKPQVYFFDMYNQDIFPFPHFTKPRIKKDRFIDIPLHSHTKDQDYLFKLRENLRDAIDRISPDVIYYNAGTDIYELDPLGEMDITAEGIIERDAIVFSMAKERNIPVFMALSGGYASGAFLPRSRGDDPRDIFNVIARSIENLHRLAYGEEIPASSSTSTSLPEINLTVNITLAPIIIFLDDSSSDEEEPVLTKKAKSRTKSTIESPISREKMRAKGKERRRKMRSSVSSQKRTMRSDSGGYYSLRSNPKNSRKK